MRSASRHGKLLAILGVAAIAVAAGGLYYVGGREVPAPDAPPRQIATPDVGEPKRTRAQTDGAPQVDAPQEDVDAAASAPQAPAVASAPAGGAPKRVRPQRPAIAWEGRDTARADAAPTALPAETRGESRPAPQASPMEAADGSGAASDGGGPETAGIAPPPIPEGAGSRGAAAKHTPAAGGAASAAVDVPGLDVERARQSSTEEEESRRAEVAVPAIPRDAETGERTQGEVRERRVATAVTTRSASAAPDVEVPEIPGEAETVGQDRGRARERRAEKTVSARAEPMPPAVVHEASRDTTQRTGLGTVVPQYPGWLQAPGSGRRARADAGTEPREPAVPEIRVQKRKATAAPDDSGDVDGGGERDETADGQDPERVPSFDVVRVGPDGDAVVAGRAPPNSRVTLLDAGTRLAEVDANRKGEFVAIPPSALESGKRRLTLRARDQKGRTYTSRTAVMVAVPGPAAAETAAIGEGGGGDADAGERPAAIRVPRQGDGEVDLLQQRAGGIGPSGDTLRLETIRYTVSGHIDVRGRATPGDRVALMVDGHTFGRADVGADGQWRIVPSRTIEPGMHRVRIEQHTPSGTVVATITTPFSSQPLVGARADSEFVVIQPGNNLWSIAERSYGTGSRYHVIYRANTDQIEDPDLIYPGQVFVLPDAETGEKS